MDQILLCTNHMPRTTLIHNSFIENYMMEANGDYVKVYLYLAKCIQYQESELSISSLADHMDNTEKDVIRALQYWEKRNLLLIERDPHTGCIIGIDMLYRSIRQNMQKAIMYQLFLPAQRWAQRQIMHIHPLIPLFRDRSLR
ncbi:MAG: hypothetical protein K2K70_09830 [Lachnospiraceae bacterium]|nr:hypothetical protein [Lachnospiraceae bacterium]